MRPIKKEQQHNQPINEQIRFPQLQLISHDGRNLGIVSRNDALRLAHQAGLDLVLLAEKGSQDYPVAKIMDFGKILYEKKKKLAEAKKHQRTIQVKELKIRPKIGDHDLQTKMKQAAEFLNEGKHLKVTLAFKGREMVTREERGTELFDKIQKILVDEHGVTNLFFEKDMKAGPFWSRIYYTKPGK